MLDIGVHDMRVATRRLRAALEIFEPCFPPNQLKADLKDVKQLADALGERRDRDVAIASLEGLSAKMPAPDQAGIASLATKLRDEQRQANEQLGRIVVADRLAGLHERLRELVSEERAMAPEQATAAAQNGSRRDGAV